MASLTIIVPDNVVGRIKAAFGHLDPTTLTWVDATTPELLAFIKAYAKARVAGYEAQIASSTTAENISEEVW